MCQRLRMTASGMSHRTIEAVLGDGSRRALRDPVAVEAPLELRAAGEPVVVLMRTPGHDEELAHGFLFGEGVIRQGDALVEPTRPGGLRETEQEHVLELGVDSATVFDRLPSRSMYASSSCGVCGKSSIHQLTVRAEPVLSNLRVPPTVVANLGNALREDQATFAATGGLHAAGIFAADGTRLVVREDVGRHNAVDKVIGWALRQKMTPLSEQLLGVSGRLSFEIVQKAVVAGFPVIVGISAPSSLAIDVAEQFRVTLCGFAREGRFNVYSHGVRVA